MSDSNGAKEIGGTIQRTLETRTAIYQRREDGIVVQRLRDKAKQTLADARENVSAFNTICEGTKHPCLVDGRAALTAEPGVREYYAGPEAAKNTSALAILVGSATMKIIANLFLSVNKSSMPTRLFTAEQEAVEWLRRVDKLIQRAGR